MQVQWKEIKFYRDICKISVVHNNEFLWNFFYKNDHKKGGGKNIWIGVFKEIHLYLAFMFLNKVLHVIYFEACIFIHISVGLHVCTCAQASTYQYYNVNGWTGWLEFSIYKIKLHATMIRGMIPIWFYFWFQNGGIAQILKIRNKLHMHHERIKTRQEYLKYYQLLI